MEFSNEVLEAMDRYFTGLSVTGYRNFNQVEQLLVMTFIEEVLTGPMSVFITKADYDSIVNAVYCLYGSCLIPYPTYEEAIVNINKQKIEEENDATLS